MKNRLLKLLAAVLLAAAYTLPAASRELTVASVAPVGSPWAKWIGSVKTKIETISAGKLTLKLVMAGQAGTEQDTIKQVARGRLDIAMVSTAPLSLLVKEVTLANAPFLWQSVKQGTCAINRLDDVLEPMLSQAGIKTLTWFDVGHRGVFSKTLVKVPGDLAGVKLRVEPQLSDVKFGQAMGATVVELPSYDSVPALQTGAANAMAQSVIVGASAGMYKAAPYVTLTNQVRQFGVIAISNALYKSLSAEERVWLEQFKALAPEMEKTFLATEAALIGKMEKDGATVYRPTAEEMSLWKISTAGVLDGLTKDIGGRSAQIRKAINDAQTNCSI